MITLKQLIQFVIMINTIEYGDSQVDDGWDGHISYTGIKRLIYGLFHNGCNELNCNMLQYMPVGAAILYSAMIQTLRITFVNEPTILFDTVN